MPDLDLVNEEPARFLGCPCVSLPYSDDEDRIPGFGRTGAVRTRIVLFIIEFDMQNFWNPPDCVFSYK